MKFWNSKIMKVFIVAFIVFIVSWAHTNVKTADNPLLRQADQVRTSIQSENWKEALVDIRILKDQFDKRRWTLELFGPIEHVNDARVNLAALMEAVENENDRDALVLLAEIQARFNNFIILPSEGDAKGYSLHSR